MNITVEKEREFERHIAQFCGGLVVRKNDDIGMQMVGSLFDVVKPIIQSLPSKFEFMNNYATSIGPIIYIPDKDWTLEQRMSVMVHECQHVAQFYSGVGRLRGGLDMWWLYLVESEARATYEAQAFATQLNFHQRMGWDVHQKFLDMSRTVESAYALKPEHVQLMQSLVEQAVTAFSQTDSAFPIAVEAARWLQAHV